MRKSLFYSLLACLWLGWAGTAHAIDSGGTPPALPGEIMLEIRHSPARCTHLEVAGKNAEARRCWWRAAGELDRYAAGDLSLAQKVKELRMDWLWRGARLSLQSPELERPAAAPASCASALSDDDAACPAAAAVPATKVKPVVAKSAKAKSRKKKVVAIPAASKKKVAPEQGLIAKTVSLARKVRRKKRVAAPAPPPALPVTINYEPIYPH